MDVKRLVVGAVVGAVALYISAYFLYDLVLADFFAANSGTATGVGKDPQVTWAIALGTLTFAALITLAIDTRAHSATIMDGVKIGALVGFLMWFGALMTLFGFWNVQNLPLVIVDSLAEGVRGAFSGGIIAAVLAKMPGSAAAD